MFVCLYAFIHGSSCGWLLRLEMERAMKVEGQGCHRMVRDNREC